LIPLLLSAACLAQQTRQPPIEDAPPEHQQIYYAQSGVTAPELIPAHLPASGGRRCTKVDGTVVLTGIVDAAGSPRDLSVMQSGGTAFDKLALDVATKDRFKPGTYNGKPAAVAMEYEIGLESCREPAPSADGRQTAHLSLRSQPVQAIFTLRPPLKSADDEAPQLPSLIPTTRKMGSGITPPRPLNSVAGNFPTPRPRGKGSGVCFVEVLIDTKGVPRVPYIVKGVDPAVDSEALQAVMKYRFKPAMKGNQPVPLVITVEINTGQF
ncbi:MAG: TonB family protein, partial [Terracidiphilus sp.]